MYKVRFNLGRGANYMKWLVHNMETKERKYYDPEEVNLNLFDCRLINKRSTAIKIFEGANKSVCAWIECRHVEVDYNVKSKITREFAYNIRYNPKVKPFWVSEHGADLDHFVFPLLITEGKEIFDVTY